MRTSYQHYVVMLDFMELHGDISKHKNPCEKRVCNKLWSSLVATLNSLRVGDSRSEEKWKKAWSDLKNNTKKKYAKIKAAASTGTCTLTLTDIEIRVMSIIERAFEGNFIPEKSCNEFPEVTIEENETSYEEKPQNESVPHPSSLTGIASNNVQERTSTSTSNIETMKHSNVQHLKWKTHPEIIEAIRQTDLFDCIKSISSLKREQMDEYDHFGFMIASKVRKIENIDDREKLMNSIHNLTYEFYIKNKKRNTSDESLLQSTMKPRHSSE